MAGFAIGALGAGLLAAFAPDPRHLSYLIVIVLLSISLVGIITVRETITRNPGAIASLRPQLRVPPVVARLMPLAFVLYIVTWAFGGYFQTFGSQIASDYLGSDNALLPALIIVAYFAPPAIVGPVMSWIHPIAGQRLGVLVFVLAIAGLVTALIIGSATLFIVAAVVAGFGQGLVFSTTMRRLLPMTPAHETAGLLSVMYAISYAGAALPALIAGQLTRIVPIFDITLGYAVLALLATIYTLAATRRQPWKSLRPRTIVISVD